MEKRKNIKLDQNYDTCLDLQAPSYWNGKKMVKVKIQGENSYSFENYKNENSEVLISGKMIKKNGNTFILDYYLKNNSSEIVTCKFNYCYVLYYFPKDEKLRVFRPVFGGVLETVNWGLFMTYPGQSTFCLTAAVGNNESIASGLFNKEQYTTVIRNVPGGNEGSIRFTLEHLTINPGESLHLPQQFICIDTTWDKSMLPYKEWLNKSFSDKVKRPYWMENDFFTQSRKAHCIATVNPPEKAVGIWLFSEKSTSRTFEYLKSEIDKAVDDGIKNGYKPLFYQFAWWKNIEKIQGLLYFDSLCGDYTEANIHAKKIVEYIHSCGCKVYLYTNFIAAGDETDVFYNHPELFITDESGKPRYNDALPMYMFCPGAPGIHKYWNKVIEYILLDLNADGIFLDQVAGALTTQTCFNPLHHHDRPDCYGRDIIKLIKYVRKKVKQVKPDACLIGELVLDTRSIYLDETHGYGYTSPIPVSFKNKEEMENHVPSEYYIFTKYLVPSIHTQIGSSENDIMNGAAGSYAYDVWKKYHNIFESEVRICKVNKKGAIAYLYGLEGSKNILAIRGNGDIGEVEITLPNGKNIKQCVTEQARYIEID